MIIEADLIARIVLSIINANTQNQFVYWVFKSTDVIITPFNGIVANSIEINGLTISLTPVVALVFCIIASFIFSELLKSFSRE